MNKILVLLLLLIVMSSCTDVAKTPLEILEVPVDMEVSRFDQLFASSSKDNLSGLKKEFPYLFSSRFPDEYWNQRFTDTIQIEVNEELAKAFRFVRNLANKP